MFCSECGFKLASSAKFCSGCGNAVQHVEVPQQAPQVQPPAPTYAQPPRQVEPDFRPTVQQAAFAPQPTTAAPQPAKIIVEMESQPFLIKLGKIQVLLDDHVISSDLWFGKTIEFTITEPGAHTIQIALKSVLTRSSELLSFQIAPGQVIKFDGLYSNFGGGVSLVQI
jgi:hypothetical protein